MRLLQDARRGVRAHGQELTLLASIRSIASHVLDLVAADHSSEVDPSPDAPRWD